MKNERQRIRNKVATIGVWGSTSSTDRSEYIETILRQAKATTTRVEATKTDVSPTQEVKTVVPTEKWAPSGRSQRPW